MHQYEHSLCEPDNIYTKLFYVSLPEYWGKPQSNTKELNAFQYSFSKELKQVVKFTISCLMIGFCIDMIRTIKSPLENYNNRWKVIIRVTTILDICLILYFMFDNLILP